MVAYISLGVAVVSLCLGIYNWYKSVLKLRADTEIHNTKDNYYSVESVISNLSSRPFTILESYVEDGNSKMEEAEVRKTKGFYIYMHDSDTVGTSTTATVYPVHISPYGAGGLERVVTTKPGPKSKLVVVTPGKKFKFRIPEQ